MKTKLLAMMLLAGGSMFAQTRVSVGIGFEGRGAGFYQPPPSYASNIPPCPGPDYTWVDGYWAQNYGRHTWVAGYWNRRPFRSDYRVAPRFDNRFNDRFDNRFNDRFDNRFNDDDHRQGFTHGFGNQDQRGYRDRSNSQDNRPGNGYANGFRGR